MSDWVLDHPGWFFLAVIVAIVAIAVPIANASDREEREHCAHLMTLAHSARDTLDVSIACEAPKHNQTVPVVMPMPIMVR